MLWSKIAKLPLVVEACEYERLHAILAHESERITTHVRLSGAGADGLGEDVSVHREDGNSLHEARPALPLAGEWTLAGFCDHVATLELWPETPEWDGLLRCRTWAFESAALDLALRQDGRSLHGVLGDETRLIPEPRPKGGACGLFYRSVGRHDSACLQVFRDVRSHDRTTEHRGGEGVAPRHL
jgi:hypothetical protein